jgi:hypothetical protein
MNILEHIRCHQMMCGNLLIRDSSEVEQLTVNQLVVGSIPTRGAIQVSERLKILPWSE